MQDKKAVEKSNKDEVFKHHIARVNEDDYALQEAPVITNEDFVIGVRPEALQLHDGAGLDGVIYGAMPTGMESTIKLRIGGFPVDRRSLWQYRLQDRSGSEVRDRWRRYSVI